MSIKFYYIGLIFFVFNCFELYAFDWRENSRDKGIVASANIELGANKSDASNCTIKVYDEQDKIFQCSYENFADLIQEKEIELFDYMIINLEGCELDVIKALGLDHIEILTIDISQNKYDKEIINYLVSKGYEFIKIQENYNRFIKYPRGFGGASIDQELFNFIQQILPKNKILLELGSGWASGEFSKYYTVYSIEHNLSWIGKYNTNYIYASIKNGWYDVNIIKKELPKHYDLILVDGPPGAIGRDGFFKNLNLFNTNVPIVFDDVNRKPEYELMVKVAKYLKRTFKVFNTKSKQFGVVPI